MPLTAWSRWVTWCMTTNQRSRGGAAMFAYEMWKERNIRPQTCLHFDKCIKQCIKCIGEKINRKYRSYQASIDPIPIPTLVSILSIFGSIRPPLVYSSHHISSRSSSDTRTETLDTMSLDTERSRIKLVVYWNTRYITSNSEFEIAVESEKTRIEMTNETQPCVFLKWLSPAARAQVSVFSPL